MMADTSEQIMTPLRVPDGLKRRNLVLVAGGETSEHKNWLRDVPEDQRSWDFALTWYGDNPPDDEDADLLVWQKGFKYDSTSRMLQAWPWLMDYEYIWLCDDDIRTSWSNIERMFDLVKEYKLDLAQPALSEDSYIYLNICKIRPQYVLRYTNFAEVMAPVFSGPALRKCRHTFDVAPTGTHIEWIWPPILGNQHNRVAILDDAPVCHTRHSTGRTVMHGIIFDKIQIPFWRKSMY